MNIILNYLHLLSLIIWLGGIIFFSFIATPAIFDVLKREEAGQVVGAIFPNYYLLGYICGAIAIITTVILGVKGNSYEQIKVVLLTIMLLTTLVAGLYILPKAQSIKKEMYASTDVKVKENLKKKFGQIHGISMGMNVLVLVSGLAVIFFIAYRLKENT